MSGVREDAEAAAEMLLAGGEDRFVLIDSTADLVVVETGILSDNIVSLTAFSNPNPTAEETTAICLWFDRDAALELAREIARRASGGEHGGIDW